ncbi:aldolase/citrate lyase family protein [Halalkalicoccus subterraneus]|uniref:aldolase/citrate lyase family protein n=1 Tax=Halalkalicoccus subterraneus TaxID=2675002 RepID=UPI000EFCE719|nr:aldolase/citrate lyase family protein [Halalkalicoccus subterraneus]
MQGIDSAAIVSQHPTTDWVWVDGEHGAIWIEEIRHKMATFPDDTAGLVRIPAGDPKEVEQVETPEIIEQIEEVAAIDGIDSLLVGPNDLSNFMGVSPDSTEFKNAVDRVLRASQENDIVPGYWVGSNDESEFVEEGWQLLSLGSASALLGDAIEERIP